MPYDIDPQPHYSLFGSLFSVLFLLHLDWTYFSLLVIVKQLRTGATDDVREDEDSD